MKGNVLFEIVDKMLRRTEEKKRTELPHRNVDEEINAKKLKVSFWCSGGRQRGVGERNYILQAVLAIVCSLLKLGI